MIAILTVVAAFACLFASNALNQEAFVSKNWKFDEDINADHVVRFTVALNLRNVDQMKKHFSDVSTPGSPHYGKYLTPVDMDELYGPTAAEKELVSSFFGAIPSSQVKLHPHGDLMHVVAPIRHIEKHLSTKLGFVSHKTNRISQRSVRAKEPLTIPADIANLVAFVSLNAPVNHVKPRGAKSLRQAKKNQAVETVAVTGGNEEALVRFNPTCANGAVNYYSPPCVNEDPKPSFTFAVTTHANDRANPYQLGTDATIFEVPYYNVYCYDNSTNACSGTPAHGTCNCLAKISPLPKYTQLRVNITETLNGVTTSLGASSLFALTDTATAHFLSELYSIPAGQQVNHGSNQSVAEFYEEFYSNKDLENFFALSGLPNATIPSANNYYIDIPNDQSDPGGEAQLDVEYIMALAPNAPTFFYSIGTYNPNDPVDQPTNEGFLDYLTLVESQDYPPLVHSLSYGDEEGDIFDPSNNATVAYGDRCNEEFMQLGLRGLTILFSSGDDGIGSAAIRDDPVGACQKAMPEWPAASPYVTAVGATMMTDKYLPVCGQNYAVSAAYPGLPITEQLAFACTGTAETVCVSTFGGVITSGGGFSDVSNRSDTAPWQETAVNNYLRSANNAAYPPLTYFNSYGRGYPDVATYGSNYFVYLNGKIQRESGTSASAPTFAAMVTLWNDIRLAYGQPPLGFIAPFLYSIAATNPQAFNDIVTGNNACGVGNSLETAPCCEYSFAASPGWDAVTGLGSPNFEIISNLVINNQTAFPNLAAYPAGTQTASTSSTGSNDDDSEVKTFSLAGLILGAVGVGLSVMLCCYVVYARSSSKEGKESLLFP